MRKDIRQIRCVCVCEGTACKSHTCSICTSQPVILMLTMMLIGMGARLLSMPMRMKDKGMIADFQSLSGFEA